MFHFKHIITLVLVIFALSACGLELVKPLDESILEVHGVKTSSIQEFDACAKLDNTEDPIEIPDLFEKCYEYRFHNLNF